MSNTKETTLSDSSKSSPQNTVMSRSKKWLKDKLLRPPFADDIFISYSRADGATYAAGLANKLANENFTCRFDQWGTKPGGKIPKELKRALRRSALLVLVGTPGAASSEHVTEEVVEFKKTGRNIIPIIFDGVRLSDGIYLDGFFQKDGTGSQSSQAGGIRKALWADDIFGAPVSLEKTDARVTGSPLEEISNRIIKNFTFTRKDERLRKAARLLGGVLAFLTIAAVVAAYLAVGKGAEAVAASEEARRQQAAAEDARRVAEDEKNRADEARKAAETEKQRAETAAQKADEQTQLANAATERANEQTRIAGEAKRRADAARADAVEQESIARSREISSEAMSSLGGQLEDSLALSLNALTTTPTPTFEARKSLLTALTYSPNFSSFLGRGKEPGTNHAFAVSRDGRFAVTDSQEDGDKLLLWRNTTPPTGPLPLEVEGYIQVHALAVSPDEKVIAAGTDNGTVMFWDAETGRRRNTVLKYPRQVLSIAYNLTGDKLAVGLVGGSIFIWDVGSGSTTGRLLGQHAEKNGFGGVTLLTFSHFDRMLASASSYAQNIVLWDLEENKQLGDPIDYPEVVAMTFGQRGPLMFDEILAVGSYSGKITIFDPEAAATEPRSMKEEEGIDFGVDPQDEGRRKVLAVFVDEKRGELLAVNAGRRVMRWRLASHEVLSNIRLKGQSSFFERAGFAADGRAIISEGSDGKIVNWEVDPPPALSSHVDNKLGAWDIAFNPKTGALSSVGNYGVALWGEASQPTVEKPKRLGEEEDGYHRRKDWLVSMAFDKDGEKLAAVSSTGRAFVLNADTLQVLDEFDIPRLPPEYAERVLDSPPLFSRNLDLALAMGDANNYFLWDIAGKERPKKLSVVAIEYNQTPREGERPFRAAAGPPFALGENVVVGTDGIPDSEMVLWDIKDRKHPRQIKVQPIEVAMRSLALSPDGKVLAAGNKDGEITLWAVDQDLRKIKSLGYTGNRSLLSNDVLCLTFSPDGKTLAAGARAGIVELWDIETARSLGQLSTGTKDDVIQLAFNRDGTKLASAGKRIIVWELSLGVWKERAQRMIKRPDGGR